MRGNLKAVALAALIAATAAVSTGYCSDPATHMAVAKR